MRRDYNHEPHEIYLDRLFTTEEAELSKKDNTLSLVLKRRSQYSLNFNLELFNGIEQFTIEAQDSIILFSQGQVDCHKILITGQSLTISPEFSLKSEYLRLSLKQTFYNFGYCEAKNLLVNEGMSFVNHKKGRLRAEKALIKVEHFAEKGSSYINQIEIKSKTVNIHGNFSALTFRIEAKKSIHFHQGSKVQFFERLICVSENANIFINGLLRLNKNFATRKDNAGEFVCFAHNIYLTQSARIDACKKINFNAAKSVKSECGSLISRNTTMIVTAPLILFDGKCQSKLQTHLNAKKYCRTGEKSEFESANIQFSGNFLFLYGKMIGKVGFRDEVQRVHLAETSIIQNCPDLNVQAIFVESYGKIQSTMLNIEAQQHLLTNDHTHYEAEKASLKSRYSELQGEFFADNFSASGGFIKTQSLGLHTKNLAELTAQELHLNGNLRGDKHSLHIQAGGVLNEARMEGFSGVQMAAQHSLINSSISSIDSETFIGQAKTFIQDGKVSSLGRAVFLAETDLALGENAKINSSQVLAGSKKDAQISGEINASTVAALQAQGTLRFMKESKIVALEQAQLSAKKIMGKPQLKTKKGILRGEEEIRLLSGQIKAEEELAFLGKSISTQATIKSSKIQFTPGENNQNSELHLGENSTIDCDYLASNHNAIRIDAKMQRVGELVLQNTDSVSITASSKIKNIKKLSIKTKEAKISGNIQGENENHPSAFILEAENTHFTKTSLVDIDKAQIHAENSDFDGAFRTGDYTLISNQAEYKRNASMRARRSATIVSPEDLPKKEKANGSDAEISEKEKSKDSEPPKARTATIEFALGSFFSARHFLIPHALSLKNEGIILPKNIQWDIQKTRNESTGTIGSKKSIIEIQCEKFTHKGLIEAERANLKCDHYFLQSFGVINATQFSLLTPFYFNFLGRIQAQQASFTTYISLRFGLEKINFGYGNSFLTFRCLPSIPYFDGWKKIAEDVRKGNINLLDPNYLQYITPLSLSLLRYFNPLVANCASIGLNSWYLYNSLAQIAKYSEEKWSGKAVDLLPRLVAVKNALFSVGFLVQDGLALCEKLSIEIPEWVHDFANALAKAQNITHDLLEDIWAYVQKKADEISDFFFPIKSNTKDPQYTEQEQKELDAINKELNNKDAPPSKELRKRLESIKKKIEHHEKLSEKDQKMAESTITWVENQEKAKQLEEEAKQKEREKKDEEAKKAVKQTELTAFQQIEQVFETWVMPTLLMVLPRFTDDSLIFCQFLAPMLTGVRSERHLGLSFSFLSPTFALSSNRQTFGYICCLDPQYAYNVNFSGQEVYLAGNSVALNFSVSACIFRSHPIADSGNTRSRIPVTPDQGFRKADRSFRKADQPDRVTLTLNLSTASLASFRANRPRAVQ